MMNLRSTSGVRAFIILNCFQILFDNILRTNVAETIWVLLDPRFDHPEKPAASIRSDNYSGSRFTNRVDSFPKANWRLNLIPFPYVSIVIAKYMVEAYYQKEHKLKMKREMYANQAKKPWGVMDDFPPKERYEYERIKNLHKQVQNILKTSFSCFSDPWNVPLQPA